MTSVFNSRKIDKSSPETAESLSHLYNITEPDKFNDFCLSLILKTVNAAAGSLFLWDECKKEFVLKSAYGPYRERLGNSHVRLKEGILGWVADSGLAVLVKNVQKDQRFVALPIQGQYRTFSFISLPLISNNKLMGVLNITEREDLQPFTEEDLIRAQDFAYHITMALSNMKLTVRLRKENKELHETILQLRQTLKEQEAFASIGKLAAHLAHELNNPLDAIRRYVNLSLDQVLEDSLARQYLFKAQEGIRHAIRIIRNLLHLSKEPQQTRFKTAELHALINESLETLYQDPLFRGLKIQKNFCNVPLYVSDKGLGIVLANLYRNAHEAMKGKGTIIIHTEQLGNNVILSVEDTGPGVSGDIAPRLFKHFVTQKNSDGTGIGLALCREIVESCGGRISYENGQRSGARFLITLPCQIALASLPA